MLDLASPVAAFVREKCVIGPDHEIDRDTLYFAYRTWADEGGYPKSPKHVFGRDIHAAVPAITDRRSQNVRKYVGIDLLPSAPWLDDDDENPPTF